MTWRIVQVVQDFGRAGGVETVAFELARAWGRAGLQQSVITCAAHDAAALGVDAELVAPSLRFVPIRGPLGHLGRLLVFPVFTILATRAVRRHPDDIVLSHGDSFAGDVLAVHAVDRASLREKRRRGAMRWLINPIHLWVAARDRWMIGGLRYRRFVAVSPRVSSELQELYGVPADRIKVIPNGVDLDRYKPDILARAAVRQEFGIGADTRLLLFAGHEFDRKGLRFVIAALEQVEPGTRLLVVGSDHPGPFRQMPAVLSGQVIFAGERRDMPALFAAADLFVLPSAYETFSLVCMEAMASGLPVLATRVGGIEDYLRDGVNGQAITQDGAAIAEAIGPILSNDAKLAALRSGARETAMRFGWDAVSRQYADLFKEVSSEKRAALVGMAHS